MWAAGWTRGRSTVLAAGLVATVLSGCGSASVPSPSTGVDGLQIPTPSLTPTDFVARIDNPRLPLVPGTTWEYRSTSSEGDATRIVTVLEETRVIGGVSATVVQEVVTDAQGYRRADNRDFYAQDASGNVWALGEATQTYGGANSSTAGSWEAGVDGAEAGLAMPAEPRIGDGYRREFREGVAEDKSSVLRIDASATVPYGDLTGLLETEDTSPLEPALVERRLYAPGVGLVREETIAGGDEVVVLVSFSGK